MVLPVVSYRNSTSNHNEAVIKDGEIQVVSYRNSTSNHNSPNAVFGNSPVVSYRNSTSNHNISRPIIFLIELYLIEILHQTTTFRFRSFRRCGCILSKFYIKPQLATAKR